MAISLLKLYLNMIINKKTFKPCFSSVIKTLIISNKYFVFSKPVSLDMGC